MFTTPTGFSPHLACAEPGEEEEEAPQEAPGPGACLVEGPPITSASLDTLIQNLVPTADYYPEVQEIILHKGLSSSFLICVPSHVSLRPLTESLRVYFLAECSFVHPAPGAAVQGVWAVHQTAAAGPEPAGHGQPQTCLC